MMRFRSLNRLFHNLQDNNMNHYDIGDLKTFALHLTATY
jgi:hypothetical protein